MAGTEEHMDGEKAEQRESKRLSLRERSRQWFITIGTVLALLTTIIGFLSDSLGVLEFVQGYFSPAPSTPDVTERVALDPVADPPTLAAAPEPTATPTITVTPSPTPIPVVAAENERLLIVAQFTNFTVDANYNVAGRIQEALSKQVASAKLEDTRVVVWPEAVEDEATAFDVLQATNATLVIWGEYDSGRVRVRFSVAGGGEELEWERFLGTPTELSTTINLDVPREAQVLALTTLGRLYRSAGESERARAAFAQALEQQPSDEDTIATLNFYLAVLDAAASPPALDRAIEAYTTVIEMRPEWFNARYNRGVAYLDRYWQSGEVVYLDLAIEDFTWTVDAESNYVKAYTNRAIAYYARNGEGDLDAAIADSTTAIEYSPTAYRAYYNRGLAYIKLGSQDQWVADLNKALEIAPDFWVTHHALCWGYALDQMPEEGLAHCDEAVKKDPSGSTRDGRGLILAQLGRLEEAAADLELYLGWLDTQPAVLSEVNHRAIYEEILEGLQAGENRVTADNLAQLR
jgi:tetratricopeptide (TPR) repeat protein